MTGYIKMIDIWMIFTMSYPFVVITLHCLEKFTEERGTRRINVIGGKGICNCDFAALIHSFQGDRKQPTGKINMLENYMTRR